MSEERQTQRALLILTVWDELTIDLAVRLWRDWRASGPERDWAAWVLAENALRSEFV